MARICKRPKTERSICSLKSFTAIHGLPKAIRTPNGTAFTSGLFDNLCEQKGMIFIPGLQIVHTATSTIERLIESLKIFIRVSRKDNRNIADLQLVFKTLRMSIQCTGIVTVRLTFWTETTPRQCPRRL